MDIDTEVPRDEDLAALLQRVLSDTGMTQKELAAKAGVPYTTLNGWVRRTRGTGGGVSTDYLRAVVAALPAGITTVKEVFEAAGRSVPGNLDTERRAKLLRIYDDLPTESQRALVDMAVALGRTQRAARGGA